MEVNVPSAREARRNARELARRSQDEERDLIRDVGPEGLLLCPGCDAPINTKPENMEAFVAAGREFGSLN